MNYLLLLLCGLLLNLSVAQARPGCVYPPPHYKDYLKPARRPVATSVHVPVATVATSVQVPSRPARVPAEQAPVLDSLPAAPARGWHAIPLDSVRARRWRAPDRPAGLRAATGPLHPDPGRLRPSVRS